MSRGQPRPATILAGRREGDLLAFASVCRMADILARRCREPSWVRTSVASLNRFREALALNDLDGEIAVARTDPARADDALQRFVRRLPGCTESQIAALAAGPKLWYRLNRVPVAWRPLPGRVEPPTLPMGTERDLTNTAVLLCLIGSGLHRSELLRLRIGDVGSLDGEGRLIPEIEAEPMAIQHTPLRGRQERITFLTFGARHALLLHLARRRAAGQALAPADPLIATPDGARATDVSVGRAVRLTSSLIDTVGDVNLELCMTTGDFFRAWGMPGSRFQGSEEFNSEDFMEDLA
jgi:integrase